MSKKINQNQPSVTIVPEAYSQSKIFKSKFSRAKPQSSSVTTGSINIEPKSDIEFCENLLSDGYVQSYVDFYHLTHRPDPFESDPLNKMKINVNIDDMKYIRDCLVDAESSRRVGNTSSVFASYIKLANFYFKKLDWKTCIFFHQKCLDVAQLTSDLRAEMLSNHSLGLVYQEMNDYQTARNYHERHEEIAVSVDVEEEIAKANTELYKVYNAIAEHYETNDEIEASIEYHLKCLESSKKSWDKSAEGEANGQVGKLLLRLSKASESLPYLRRYSEIATELGEANSRCKASSALALALDALGMLDKALDELNLVQAISEQAGDLVLQLQACKAMGTLYSKVGKLNDAVVALQRHFDLLKILDARSTSTERKSEIVSVQDLDLARTYVGISKGNATLGSYIISLQFDFQSLLDWKLTRSSENISLRDQK